MTRFVILSTFAAATACSALGAGEIRITEWMYSGANGEFVELTNVGDAPVDMAGWSFDDDSALPGVFSLSGFGSVAPGESVIFTESTPALFRANWNLPLSIKVLGGVTNNLGRNDQINIFNGSNALADVLTYGDEVFPGSIRTQNISGNPLTPAALGADDVYQWGFSVVGDVFGSYKSLGNDLGNPGAYIPEPASLTLLSLGAVALLRRR